MKNSVRFTERASGAIAAARDASASLGHSYVGTEHLLLGVAAETESLGARVRGGRGLVTRAVSQLVDSESGSGWLGAPEQWRSPYARLAIERAAEDARRLGHGCIGTEHQQLGQLRPPACRAQRALSPAERPAAALQHRHRQPGPRRGEGRGHARRSAADDQSMHDSCLI